MRLAHRLVALACTTIAIGLLPVALLPAAAVVPSGHSKAAPAKTKKKCKKKRGRSLGRKCRSRKTNVGTQDPSGRPAAAVGQAARPDSASDQDQEPTAGGCGAPIAKSTGGDWECTFSDDFDGTSLDLHKWIPQQTDTSGYLNGPAACFVGGPENVSVSDGTLKLTARQESAPIDCGAGFTAQYTSGMVSTAQGRFSQTYGRFEIRAKVPPAQVKGLQSSFWLWPADSAKYGSYPASGEIDVAEMFSSHPDRAIPYVHYEADDTDPSVTNTQCTISNLAEFHTYTLEWTQSSIKIDYDGKTCLEHELESPQPFDQPFFIALTQALGVGTNEFDPETTPLPATTEVDYVRAWK